MREIKPLAVAMDGNVLISNEDYNWLTEQADKVKKLEDVVEYILTAKPSHYDGLENMLNDFKSIIELTIKNH